MSDDYDYDEADNTEWLETKQPLKALVRSVLHIFNDARQYLARIIEPRAFTYFVQVPTPQATYAGGQGGVATMMVNTPFEIIDVQIACAPKTFRLSSFWVGDSNQFLGAALVPADLFFAAVEERGVRFKEAQRGQTIQVGFVNSTESAKAEALTIIPCLSG